MRFTAKGRNMNRTLSPFSAETFVAALLVVFAVAQIYAAAHLHMSEDYTLGPGAMPIIYSIGLLMFSGYLLVDAVKKGPKAGRHDGADYKSGILCVLFLLLFISSIYVVGFLLSTVMFCFLFCLFISKIGLVKSVVFSIAWGGTVYAVFDYLLQIPLETGMLFS
jgi:hypothetical protein